MKFLLALAITLAMGSAVYFLYAPESNQEYTDKAGLLNPEEGVVMVCRGFPRLRTIYVKAAEEAFWREWIARFCEGNLGRAISGINDVRDNAETFEEDY